MLQLERAVQHKTICYLCVIWTEQILTSCNVWIRYFKLSFEVIYEYIIYQYTIICPSSNFVSRLIDTKLSHILSALTPIQSIKSIKKTLNKKLSKSNLSKLRVKNLYLLQVAINFIRVSNIYQFIEYSTNST